jgi:hypothetical protein
VQTTVVIGVGRVAAGVLVGAVLGYAYALRFAVGDGNPFNFFGYFTNQTSLFASGVLIALGALTIAGRRVPDWLSLLRGIATAYLLVVAVIYNVLVPGTGSAPAWVSLVLHVIFPILVAFDWLLVGDRPRLRWRHLWLLLPYPVVWLVIVLIRGVTDGWVPYGFLLPERGLVSLLLHIVGLLVAIVVAGIVVWMTSGVRARIARRSV